MLLSEVIGLKESSFVFRAHLGWAGMVIKGMDKGNISNVSGMLELCHLCCGEVVLPTCLFTGKKNVVICENAIISIKSCLKWHCIFIK